MNIEDITQWREDMNFMFEWQNNTKQSFLPQENKIHIFKPPCNVVIMNFMSGIFSSKTLVSI